MTTERKMQILDEIKKQIGGLDREGLLKARRRLYRIKVDWFEPIKIYDKRTALLSFIQAFLD